MEDATSNTLQEIEKLKQKISGYRDTLMTLKVGTSFEDYLIMKKEFELLKSQISYIEDLTKTMDEKQNTQNEMYEEQVRQFAFQLSLLHQTVEELSQKIVEISNKLIISEDEEILEDPTETINSATDVSELDKLTKSSDDIKPTKNQPSVVSNQPSYMQLRNLGKPLLKQEQQEKIEPEKNTQYQDYQIGQRYSQFINNHSNFQFQSFANEQNAHTNNLRKDYYFRRLTTEMEKQSANPPLPNLNEAANEEVRPAITSEPNENSAVIEQQNRFPHGVPIQKVNKQEEVIEVESKKQKNSFFSNIFRKQ